MGSKAIAPLFGRTLLGGILGLAGLLKLGQPELFAKTLAGFGLLPVVVLPFVSWILPTLEALIGFTLLVGLLTRISASIAALLSAVFAGVLTRVLARGLSLDCGCFGGDSQASWSHVGLNLAMLLVALWLVSAGAGRWSLDETLLKTPTTHWPSWIVTLGLSLVLAVAIVGWPMKVPKGAGQDPETLYLKFDPEILKLGEVKQGQMVKRAVAYRNVSTQALEIERVESTCGCTVPEPSVRFLKPGDAGELSVYFSDLSGLGPKTVNVNLHLKGVSDPVSLKVEAELVPVVQLVPDSLTLVPGESKTVEVESSSSQGPLRLLQPLSPTPLLSITVDDSSRLPSRVTMTVKLDRKAKGPGRFSIPVFTNVEGQPPILLRVTWS